MLLNLNELLVRYCPVSYREDLFKFIVLTNSKSVITTEEHLLICFFFHLNFAQEGFKLFVLVHVDRRINTLF